MLRAAFRWLRGLRLRHVTQGPGGADQKGKGQGHARHGDFLSLNRQIFKQRFMAISG
jgi:hypothetical protein